MASLTGRLLQVGLYDLKGVPGLLDALGEQSQALEAAGLRGWRGETPCGPSSAQEVVP